MTIIADQYYYNVDMKVYRELVEDFVPAEIVDFHGHIYKQEFFKEKLPAVRMAFTLAEETYTLEEAQADLALMWPGKRASMLYFGAPIRQVDIRASNAYVAQGIREHGVAGLFMPLPSDNAGFLGREVRAGGFVGFKPYLELLDNPGPEPRISDFVSEAQLEVANQGHLIITLHIPRALRLADPSNREDIVRIAQAAPQARIVLAHAGRAYCLCDIPEESVAMLRKLANVYFDLALVHTPDIIEILLREFGPERVLFGSDMPAGAEHGANICINGSHYYVLREPRSWGVSPQPAVTPRFTFYAYETVRGVREAARRLGLVRADTDAVFADNAKRLIAQARARAEQHNVS